MSGHDDSTASGIEPELGSVDDIGKKTRTDVASLPKFIVLNNTLLVYELTNITVGNEPTDLSVRPVKNKKVYTIARFSTDGKHLGRSCFAITSEDVTVLDAVGTMTEAKRATFTVEELCRLIDSNFDAHKKESPKKIERVKDCVDRLRFTEVRIDMTQEAEHRGLKKADGKRWVLSAYLIPAVAVDVESESEDGIRVVDPRLQKYKLLALPPLYEYGRRVGQNLRFEAKETKTTGQLYDRGEEAVIKRYVLRKAAMSKAKGETVRLRYYSSDGKKGMFDELGLGKEDYFRSVGTRNERSWKARRQRLHAIVTQVLDSFVENGILSEYAATKTNRMFDGATLKAAPDDERGSNGDR